MRNLPPPSSGPEEKQSKNQHEAAEKICPSKSLVNFQTTARRYIPEGRILYGNQ
jgi:hypothetical protein